MGKKLLQNVVRHDKLDGKDVMPVQTPKKPVTKIIAFGAAGVFLAVWILLKLPCIPRTLTGLICPGCGMCRAWLAVLQGQLGQAFAYHPMFWCVPVLLLYIWFDGRLFPNKWMNTLVLGLLLCGLLVCYIIRLVLFLNGTLAI